jgi:hypothetical protein
MRQSVTVDRLHSLVALSSNLHASRGEWEPPKRPHHYVEHHHRTTVTSARHHRRACETSKGIFFLQLHNHFQSTLSINSNYIPTSISWLNGAISSCVPFFALHFCIQPNLTRKTDDSCTIAFEAVKFSVDFTLMNSFQYWAVFQ